MTAPKICPECGDDFGSWPDGDDEGVWWREDDQNYCSAECVVHRIRQRNRAARLAAEAGEQR